MGSADKRIAAVTLYSIRIPLRQTFAHARHERSHSEAIIVKLEADAGVCGWGEIRPRPYLTGETIESVFENTGPALATRWLGRGLVGREQIRAQVLAELDSIGSGLALFAGFELALLDLAGKTFDFHVGDLLNDRVLPSLPAGVVIGFEVPTDKLDRHCATIRMAGRKHVKVKVGLDGDVERLAIVSKVLKEQASIRIDANAAWTEDQAIAAITAMQGLGIESVEQPVAAEDLTGMRRVREVTGMPVMADESLCSYVDGERLIAAQAADIFNIRVGKCGGLFASQRLVELAMREGLSCHLGTLVGETIILSTASLVFGARNPGFACLEGKGQNRFLLEADLGQERAASSPGLGLWVDEASLARYAVGTPRRFS